MKNASKTLKENKLFKGLNENEIEEFLLSIGAYKKTYSKGDTIYFEGDVVRDLGIVLSGKAYIENFDLDGNKVIFSCIEAGGHFADSYALVKSPTMVNVTAGSDSEILFIDVSKLLLSKTMSEKTAAIVFNLLRIMARKNMVLSRKIINTSSKTIRERIFSYLREESIMHKSKGFDIPYDRQALSDYLNCDRTQLSKELSKMKKEGLLDYKKNHFEIKF